MEQERVTHRVADWDYLCNSKRRSGWHHDIKDILTRCNLQNIYESRDVSNLSESRLIHSTKDVLMKILSQNGNAPFQITPVWTGRYRNIPHSQRVCSSCNKQAVENTEHFLLVCEKHKQLREKLFKTVSEKLNIQFVNMSCVDRLSILLSHSLVVNDTAKYAIEAYRNR